jgi:hypothetical protein
LAEQLTLNQSATPENDGELALLADSAARGAAVDAENGGALRCAANGKEGQGGDWRAANDAELAEVAERWPVLPEAVRLAILALVRTAQ